MTYQAFRPRSNLKLCLVQFTACGKEVAPEKRIILVIMLC